MRNNGKTPQQTAKEILVKFGGSKKLALIAVDIYIDDLQESLSLCKELNFHGHAGGLITGSLACWYNVRKFLNE